LERVALGPCQLHALEANRAPAARGAELALHLLTQEAQFDRTLGQPPPRDADSDRERRDQTEQNLDSNERRAAYHPRASAAPLRLLAWWVTLRQSVNPATLRFATAKSSKPWRPAMAKELKLGD